MKNTTAIFLVCIGIGLMNGISFAQTEPTTAAPTPTVPANKAISLFSNAYTNVMVDTWSAVWDVADVADVQIAGNDTKKYTNLVFAGIEFTTQPINATASTHFHMDIWTPNPTAAPAAFRIKLVDFGADGVFGGGDDVEHELTFNASSTPPLATGSWVSFDIPLSNFVGLSTRAHLAQLIISGDLSTVFVDNVYLYTGDTPPPLTEPAVAAPTPTVPANKVISLFSNAYTNVMVDTWSAVWDVANVADVQIAGNDTKKYTNLVFAGIEFTSQPINATASTHFHMDIWTPNPTAAPAAFRIKLVDFGANGVFGGGDDVEHELTFNANSTPPLATGSWISFDIPLSSFVGLSTRAHLAQLIISGDLSTVYVDNVYLHSNPTAVEDSRVIVPDNFALQQNFPNPFNPGTTIAFSLPEASHVSLKIYDLNGKQVASLLEGRMSAGTHSVQWQAENLPSGLYFAAFEAGAHKSFKKMILAK